MRDRNAITYRLAELVKHQLAQSWPLSPLPALDIQDGGVEETRLAKNWANNLLSPKPAIFPSDADILKLVKAKLDQKKSSTLVALEREFTTAAAAAAPAVGAGAGAAAVKPAYQPMVILNNGINMLDEEAIVFRLAQLLQEAVGGTGAPSIQPAFPAEKLIIRPWETSRDFQAAKLKPTSDPMEFKSFVENQIKGLTPVQRQGLQAEFEAVEKVAAVPGQHPAFNLVQPVPPSPAPVPLATPPDPLVSRLLERLEAWHNTETVSGWTDEEHGLYTDLVAAALVKEGVPLDKTNAELVREVRDFATANPNVGNQAIKNAQYPQKLAEEAAKAEKKAREDKTDEFKKERDNILELNSVPLHGMQSSFGLGSAMALIACILLPPLATLVYGSSITKGLMNYNKLLGPTAGAGAKFKSFMPLLVVSLPAMAFGLMTSFAPWIITGLAAKLAAAVGIAALGGIPVIGWAIIGGMALMGIGFLCYKLYNHFKEPGRWESLKHLPEEVKQELTKPVNFEGESYNFDPTIVKKILDRCVDALREERSKQFPNEPTVAKLEKIITELRTPGKVADALNSYRHLGREEKGTSLMKMSQFETAEAIYTKKNPQNAAAKASPGILPPSPPARTPTSSNSPTSTSGYTPGTVGSGSPRRQPPPAPRFNVLEP